MTRVQFPVAEFLILTYSARFINFKIYYKLINLILIIYNGRTLEFKVSSEQRDIEGLWRNGSASDSRSDGWAFESLWPHFF